MLAVGASLAFAATSDAATFSVDSTEDMPDSWPGNGVCESAAGTCTLRAAVQEANASSGADTILVPGGRYELGVCCSFAGLVDLASQLSLLDDVTIAGAGARKTVIHSSPTPVANSVFISPKSSSHVVISAMTLSGGSSGGNGGAISNAGSMALTRVIVRDSSAAGSGGGIATAGPLAIADSLVASNRARKAGGGIAVLSGGSLTATNTTVSANKVSGRDRAFSMDGVGAGIANVHGTVALTNVTLAGNTTSEAGGGALSGPATLTNTILANPATTGNCAKAASGAPSSTGHNLADDASCALTGPGDLASTNPLLDELAENNGSTDTHELLPGSPALDAADAAACPAVDQRGIPRPLGAGCDIGALEHQPVADLSVSLDDRPDPIPADDDLTYTLTISNAGPDPAFDAQVHHDLPPGVVLIAVPQNCSVLAGKISCGLGSLPAGARYTASVIVRPETMGALTSLADVSSRSIDPVASGNVATAATMVLNRMLGKIRTRDGRFVAPVEGRTVVADVVSGTVLLRKPGEQQFTRFEGADEIPVGSTIDTKKGRIRLTSATDANGNIQSAIFYGGTFVVTQKPGNALVTLKLVGGSFRSCRAGKSSRIRLRRLAHASSGPVASAARTDATTSRAKPRRAENTAAKRQVWGRTDGKAKYKTQGRNAAATVRGTIWLTQDRCDGTLVKVRRGLVAVRDLARKKTKLVRAGKQLLVRAKRR